MATTLSSLETQVRRHLIETTASYWSSDELVTLMNRCIKELWRAILDLNQEHFLTIDATNVTLAASTSTLSGVPTDVFRIVLIEPRDMSDTSPNVGLQFTPKDYNHPDFVAARSHSAVSPSQRELLYAVISAGAPVAAPTIRVAPQVDAAVNLTLAYIPVLADKIAANDNPIPGESDQAIIAYTVAFARTKEREDRIPDPEWLSIFATEKQSLLTALTPRSTQEPEFVEGFLEELGY